MKFTQKACRLVAVGIALTLHAGCAHHRIGSDLTAYVNNGILAIADMETEALAAYAAVVGDNYTSNAAVYEALEYQVVPLYEQFLAALKHIAPETREVIQLHAQYVRGAETILKGFQTKRRGLAIGSVPLVLEGNAAIEKGRIQTEKWRDRLYTYLRKYDVLYKKGNNA